jgi:HEAT repeat protein
MSRTAITLALFVLVLATAPARAQEQDDALLERVDAYLGAIDRPIPPEAWRALGPDAVPSLEDALRWDPITARRAAAAAGLSAIGGDRAVQALLEAANVPLQRWSVRSTAVRGLGRTMAPAQLKAALQPMLEESEAVKVRALAAEVLARNAPIEACTTIRAQLDREAAKDQAAFARAMARCDAP